MKNEIEMENDEKKERKILFFLEYNDNNFIIYQIHKTIYGTNIYENKSFSKVYDDKWKLLEKIFNEYMENKSGN